MADEKTNPKTESPKPAEAGKDQGGNTQGETRKVDTKVQEEAAKEREESGGYD